MRQALDEAHAGLDRHGGQQAYEQRLRSIVENPPSDTSAFLWLLSEALAELGDGHTLLKWPKDHLAKLASRPIWMPLRFTIAEESLWIAEAARSDLAGFEVLSIDGRPWSALRPILHRAISADARQPQAKDWSLSEEGKLTFLLGLRFGYSQAHRLLLREAPSSELLEIELPSVAWSEVPKPPSATRNPWQFSITDGIGMLKIKHFVPYFYRRDELDYAELLSTTFAQLSAHCDSLILDLRGNRGGSEDWVRDLLQFLLSEPFVYYRSAEMKRRTFPFLAELRPDMELPTAADLEPGPGGGWTLPEAIACQDRYRPHDNSFTGPVLVLTDGGTFSAAAELASMLQSRGRASLVGEPPGGAYSGNTSGLVTEITLPASGARVRVPMAAFWLDVRARASETLKVDYPVREPVLSEDPVLDLALEIARRSKRGFRS